MFFIINNKNNAHLYGRHYGSAAAGIQDTEVCDGGEGSQ